LGVPIFFVISGLVITLSIGDRKITSTYAAQFIIRRSLRLDPTYWAAIGLAIILLLIKNTVSVAQEPLPTGGNLLAHMFYLQEILQVRPLISVVFWTLCLEVQFYLFYLCSLWLTQQFTSVNTCYGLHMLLLLGVGVGSIFLDRGLISISQPGLFIGNWHYFLIGILIANVIKRRLFSTSIMILWLLYETITCAYFGAKPYQMAGIGIGVFLLLLWKNSLMDTVFTARVWQYLGKISYTLYLVHPDIGWKFISMARMVFHGHIPQVYVTAILVLSIAVSIFVAHIFHLAFERPSLILVEKIKHHKLFLADLNIERR
jgi:peptidoglycan/LPS O-acetylase OafA/YrhL